MENEYTASGETRDLAYDFLYNDKSKGVFGHLDFELKSGKHIQFLHPEQEDLYLFIKKHFESLSKYYSDFFQVQLSSGGVGTETYYYLDFDGANRGEIPNTQRRFLAEEHLLIGIFTCKIYNVDFNSEESSLTTFKKLLRQEYEEYKDDFYRLLAYTKKEIYMSDDDIEVDKSIVSAFKEFKRLGWVYFKNEDQFVVMPSIERLRKLYADEIRDVQKLVLNENPAK